MSCQFVHSIGALDSSVQAYSTALMPIPAETDALLTQEVSAHTRTNAKSGTLIRVWGAWDVYRQPASQPALDVLSSALKFEALKIESHGVFADVESRLLLLQWSMQRQRMTSTPTLPCQRRLCLAYIRKLYPPDRLQSGNHHSNIQPGLMPSHITSELLALENALSHAKVTLLSRVESFATPVTYLLTYYLIKLQSLHLLWQIHHLLSLCANRLKNT